MNIVYRVDLTGDESEHLTAVVASKAGVQKRKRAQILLAAAKGIADATIADTLPCGLSTIYRTKKRLVTEGLAASLEERSGRGASRKLTKQEEAKLIALACSAPPEGRRRWTLELLANEFVRLVEHPTISKETIRRRLGENDLKPWQRKMWCIPKVDAEYVARMEDVLDLYMEPPDEKRPVVSFDETPTQLIGEARIPVPVAPGRPERIDYEYRRNGTANLFVFVDANRVLAAREGDRPADQPRLRELHARTGGLPLPARRPHPSRPR
jgi:transposase